jgi:DEAD/DEAH box helicase domain-containing protein
LWLFAQVLRRGSQVALDLQPDELAVGLQPARLGSFESRRIFIADRLENGAGYAPELAQPDNVRQILRSIVGQLATDYEAESHAECSDSCPDCLRSWDNRRLHGMLDWRLALDVADLAVGQALPMHRWQPRAQRVADVFVRAYGQAVPLRVEDVNGHIAILREDRESGLLVGHPLWHRDRQYWTSDQQTAAAQLRAEFGVRNVGFTDPFLLARFHSQVFAEISGES